MRPFSTVIVYILSRLLGYFPGKFGEVRTPAEFQDDVKILNSIPVPPVVPQPSAGQMGGVCQSPAPVTESGTQEYVKV